MKGKGPIESTGVRSEPVLSIITSRASHSGNDTSTKQRRK